MAPSRSNSTESHAFQSARKLPDYFPHTLCMQPDKNVWQRITVISYVCVCVCLWKCVHACVCAFFLQCLNCCQSSSSDSGISICRAERYMWLGYILTGLCKSSSLHSPHRWGRLRMMQRAQWAQHECCICSTLNNFSILLQPVPAHVLQSGFSASVSLKALKGYVQRVWGPHSLQFICALTKMPSYWSKMM